MCAGIVSLTQSCFSPHQLLMFITQKDHNWLLGVLDILLRLCVRASADTTSAIQARPHNTLSVLFFPGNLVVLWGWIQAHIGPKTGSNTWRDPGVEGRQEPAAEERQWKLLNLWPDPSCMCICSSVLSIEPHCMKNCAWGETSLYMMSPNFAFSTWIVRLFLWLFLKTLFGDYETRTTLIRISTP